MPKRQTQRIIDSRKRNSGTIILGTTGTASVVDDGLYLLADGSRDLTGNLSADPGVLIDGVDISAHAANASAHHAPATAGTMISIDGQQVSLASGSVQYQIPITGASPFAPEWTSIAAIVGTALNWGSGRINVDDSIAGTALEWLSNQLHVASSIAGTALNWGSGQINVDSSIAGTALEWLSDQIHVASSIAGNGLAWSGGVATYETITQRGTATSAAGAGTPAGYQTVALRAAASGNSYTTSLGVSRPTGVADGDVLLAVVAWYDYTLTPPSGWTQIGVTRTWSIGSNTAYARVYYKVASSEPASYTWGLSSTNDIACTIVAYSNVDKIGRAHV